MVNGNGVKPPLEDLFQAIGRHWRKSVFLFLGIVGVVGTITFLIPTQYRSEGKLFVRLGRENATLDPTATLSQTPIVAIPQSRETEINSVVEILQSRVLAEKVVDALGSAVVLNQADSEDASQKDSGPEDRERAVLALGRALKVEAARKSNVIQVTYLGRSPKLSQSIVAKLIDAYVDEHLRLNRPNGSHEFFMQQTDRLREDLAKKEGELRDLKNKTGLASPTVQRELLIGRIGRLEDELLHAESAKAVAEAKVKALRERLSQLPETQVAAETTGFSNEGTDRMRDQFYTLQVREKEAQSKYTEEHPKMQVVRDQIATSRAILDEEEHGRKQVTKEPGRLYQQVEMTLLSEEPALHALETEAVQIRSQLATVRTELNALNENEIQIAALQRDVALLDADYRKYSASLEQARIDQQLDSQRMSNISIVQPASYEPKPVYPRKMLGLLLGVGAGLFGAMALPLALERFRILPSMFSTNVRISPSPILARVPRMPECTASRRPRSVVR